jgi:nucleoid-associated protein YgaU
MTLGAERSLLFVRASRLVTVAGVLLCGLCAAWPFRHDAPPALPARPTVIPLELTLRRQDLMVRPSAGSDPSPASDLDAVTAGTRAQAGGKSQFASLESLTPPPDLPVAFQPRSEPAEPMTRSSANEESKMESAAASRFARPRSYRLRDGDTLEKLAERFLGSGERAMEIFEANREALARPDLLPVGTTITIPAREKAL